MPVTYIKKTLSMANEKEELPKFFCLAGSFSKYKKVKCDACDGKGEIPFGNSGRMGRSIKRAVSVSFSLGRPISRRK